MKTEQDALTETMKEPTKKKNGCAKQLHGDVRNKVQEQIMLLDHLN